MRGVYRGLALVLGVAAGLTVAAVPMEAQGGRLEVTLSSGSIAFPAPGMAHFDVGWIDHPGGVIASVIARPQSRAWELRVRTDNVTMGGYGKPVGDILWRVAGTGVWTPLTGTDQAVTQGTGDQSVALEFRIQLGWALDSPDSYLAGLTFTLVGL